MLVLQVSSHIKTHILANNAILHVKIVSDIRLINVWDVVILHFCYQVVLADKHALLIALYLKDTVSKVQNAVVLMVVDFAPILDFVMSVFLTIWELLLVNIKTHSLQHSSLIYLLHLQELL